MPLAFETPSARFQDGTAFSGTQLDDFLLALSSSPSEVLVLGSGPGAVSLSLAQAAPLTRVYGVDADVREVALAEAFRSYLEVDNARFGAADALASLRAAADGSYDAILVDLYDGSDASPLNTDETFWLELKRVAAQDGLVLVNVWGIPEHLDPLSGETPANSVISAAMRAGYRHYLCLHHLRNTTLIFGSAAALKDRSVTWELPSSSPLEEFAVLALRGKVGRAAVRTVPASVPPSRVWSFADAQALFESRLEDHFVGGGTVRAGREAVRSILATETASRGYVSGEISMGRPSRCSLVSTHYHADVVGQGTERRLGWFPGWVLESYEELSQNANQWLYGSALWHIATTAVAKGQYSSTIAALHERLAQESFAH